MLQTTLEKIGLTKKQAKIYLACLKLGETSIKDMAKKSGIKRTTIYDLIDGMIDAGYIKITTKGKKKKFLAVDPKKLLEIIKKREKLLNQIMPELNAVSNVNNLKPKIWFFEGTEALKKAYEDTLRYPNITIYQWSGGPEMIKAMGVDWIVQYVKKRLKKKIKALTIISDSPEARSFKKLDKKHDREMKIIGSKNFLFRTELDVYKNRVAMISAKDQIGVIIESEPIAHTLRTIFKLCWGNIS